MLKKKISHKDALLRVPVVDKKVVQFPSSGENNVLLYTRPLHTDMQYVIQMGY